MGTLKSPAHGLTQIPILIDIYRDRVFVHVSEGNSRNYTNNNLPIAKTLTATQEKSREKSREKVVQRSKVERVQRS